MIIDLKKFVSKIRTFDSYYMKQFDGFWRWKLKTETEGKHILDENHRRETCRRVWSILRGWQAYRPCDSTVCLKVLKDSLRNASEAYNQIRSYTLLEFDKVSNHSLELIWHELGRIKEEGGNTSGSGHYYIVSLSKHLMFLWGQTLAFDSRVKAHIPRFNIYSYVINHTKWSFETWKTVMGNFQEGLKQMPQVVDLFKKESIRRYGTDSNVPYGRFLDIYYH